MRRPSPNVDVIDAAAVPLDQSELNGLIKAARNESYRPSDAVQLAPVEEFRPKSLLELARQRREPEVPAQMAVVGARPDDAATMADAGGGAVMALVAHSDDGQADLPPVAAMPVAPSPVAAGQAGEDPASTAGVPLARPEATPPVTDARAAEGAAPTARPESAPPEPARAVDAALIEKVRAEAYVAGRADAEAAAEESLSAATRAFEAAAQALLHPAEDALAALRAEITDAVLQIASERAGIEIDAMPAAFVERIEALADRIHSRATQPVLRINPADLTAIETHIAGSDALSMRRIVASKDLQRGDVDLAVEGLRLSDRIMGQPATRKGRRPAAKPASDSA